MACQHCQEIVNREVQRQMKLVGILPVTTHNIYETPITVQDVIDRLESNSGERFEWWFNNEVKIAAFYACDMINIRQVLENGDIARTDTSDAIQILFPHIY